MNVSLHTVIDIDALPARVWAVLTDFAAAPTWNPFVREISGEIRPGGRLSVLIAPPGKRPMRFKPTVLVADEECELRWLGRFLVPGLLDGEHWFRLTALPGARTRFEQGEAFSGLLVRLLSENQLIPIRQGFEAMNAALKRQAEMAGTAR